MKISVAQRQRISEDNPRQSWSKADIPSTPAKQQAPPPADTATSRHRHQQAAPTTSQGEPFHNKQSIGTQGWGSTGASPFLPLQGRRELPVPEAHQIVGMPLKPGTYGAAQL